MKQLNQRWRIGGCVILAVGLLLSAPLRTPAVAQGGESADRMIVMREDERSFRITRVKSVEALVTFLSPTTFRVRILPLEAETTNLPEYVTTKSDESLPTG